MLNTALRVDSGLTYGATSRVVRRAQPGSIEVTSFTRTDATVQAIDLALGVLGQLHGGGIDDEMLASAQSYILGQFPTTLETAEQIGAALGLLEAFRLDVSYFNDYGAEITAATTDSVAAVIASVYPLTDNLVFVLLGDAAQIRDSISQYGPVTEMAITEPGFHAPAED